MLQSESADLLGQVVRMAADLRAEGTTAAPELGSARGAVTGAAGALLLVDLLRRPVDVRTVLDGVRAGLALRELPADATGKQIGARLETEDGLVQIDRTGASRLQAW